MSRRRYRIAPPADAVSTAGELMVFFPEHDLTGNAASPAPLLDVVWGATATGAGAIELGPDHDSTGNPEPPTSP